MGALTSILSPKRPRYKPIALPRAESSPPPPPTVPTQAQPSQAEQEAQRVEDTLRRARGQSSTILTSFRGVLTPETAKPARKTLLGE